jgi:predicted lipoprotein with Yx(FWY)xxD motif
MSRKAVLAAAFAVALAAAGVAAAAAVTHQSSRSAAASATAGRVTLHTTKLGKVLATSSGRTLYLFMADHKGKSACYGQCAAFWPPLVKKGKVSAGKGVKAGLLGTSKRKSGQRQVTYKGHPLYLFKLDKRAGQASGQGSSNFGGKWYVVNASGSANKKKAPSTGTTTTDDTTTEGTTTHYTTTLQY